MGKWGVCCVAAALAMAWTPVAAAHRLVSVGYSAPSALHGLRVVERIPQLHVAEVRVPDARAAARLRTRPGIRFVDALARRFHTGGPDLPATVSVLPEWQLAATRENLVPAWVAQAASRVTIAVVDTGADLSVPSLAEKSPVAWNVVSGDSSVSDSVGHGTFVASLAGGASLGFGGNAQLMIVQANRGGTGFSDVDEANAIVWAVDHGANIVNLSIGGPETSAVERYAISYALSKGVLLVAAAGNAAQSGNPTMYPAALIGRDGLVVGASDPSGRRAAFSTTGAYVDLLAPGVNVLGALTPGAESGLFTAVSTPGAAGAYGYGTGTSYSSPEVAGAAALVMAANPSLGALGVAQILEQTATGKGLWTKTRAFGVLDVEAAVQRALGPPSPAALHG